MQASTESQTFRYVLNPGFAALTKASEAIGVYRFENHLDCWVCAYHDLARGVKTLAEAVKECGR